MADEERKVPEFLQDVDESELGQLRPSYSPTPYNTELQSWNRGRSLGRSGESYQTGRSSALPEFTQMKSELLTEAAQKAAENLKQYPDITASQQEAQQRDRSFADDRFNTLKENSSNKTTPNLHENDMDLEHHRSVEKEQKKENDRER